MRSHVILAVFKRNFWSYFSGVIGYLFIVVFVFLGAFAAFQERFFNNDVATLDQLNEWFPSLLLFIVPAITMSVWSEERKLGTEELLFTLPVSDLEVLIGKYLAVISVYSVALVFSLTHAMVLRVIGDPDAGVLMTTYLGYWLAGCAMLSAGMMASYLTSSATVAFIIGALVAAIPVFVGQIPVPAMLEKILGSDQFFDQMSVSRQLEPLGIGLIPPKSILYFASITIFMLYLNLVLIGQRHWRGGVRGSAMGLQYFVRAVALGLILISVNVLAAGVNRRVDMTAEHVYSMSKTTRDLLSKITDKRPVTIQAFVSREVPREYVPVKTTLLGLLGQYEQVSNRNVSVRVVTVDPASPQADEAKKYGIEGRKVQSDRAGRVQVDEVYLGVVVNSGASEVVVPFFDLGLPVEYELTRSVWTVAAEKRKTIGILETDAKLNGGFDMSSFRSSPEWRIVTELKKQYNVENVSPAAPIDESKYDVVIAVLPSSLGQNESKNFVDYVKKGKPVLIFDDPLPAINPSLAPRQPKPKQGGNPMMQMGMPNEQKAEGGKATSLVNALGIQWKYDQVVFDQTVMTLHPEWSEMLRPEIVSISRQSGMDAAFNHRSEITSGLQEMFLFFTGSIRPRKGSKLEFTPLLLTGRRSGLLEWDDLIKANFMGGMQIEEDPPRVIGGSVNVKHDATTYAGSSGVAVGASSARRDTVIGPAGAHKLAIQDTSGNGSAGTVSLNGGAPVKFTNTDTNLKVIGSAGESVYIDTTAISPKFNGTVDITATGSLTSDGGATSVPIDFTEKQQVTNASTGEVIAVNSTKIRKAGIHYSDDNDFYVVAAEITSPKDAAGDTKINAIYVADSDLISDWFFMVRERKQFRLNLDNVTFVLNAVDHLAGDSSFIDLRKRRAKHRSLTRVEEQTAKYIQRSTMERQEAADDAKSALDDAKKRFAEKVDKIKKDTTMDDQAKIIQLQIAEQEERRRIEVEETIINQRKEHSIEASKVESDRNVRAIEHLFYAGALIVSPIPAVLFGIVMLLGRVSRENKVIDPARRKRQ
jgi:ABC-2 type transport system permease protein